ncbi:hypothetical protein [uncultured Draconibacterium sp.]|uniref:hypothetical protein n=1 Tax=uncultured Draconibacterium sp. TaxID=1573823 RepID=UPI0025DCA173|nr:hypothetical protein [uncultured Draconibacterium sp.]
MKKLAFFSILLTTLSLFSCNSSNKSEEIASYTYEEKSMEMSDELKALIPEWVEEGTVCYGLMIQLSSDNKPVRARPIKAKVVQINENAIKMKALESVKMAEIKSCSKFLVTKGETWDEKEGQLYLTLEEAINALKEMNLYIIGDKVTVD